MLFPHDPQIPPPPQPLGWFAGFFSRRRPNGCACRGFRALHGLRLRQWHPQPQAVRPAKVAAALPRPCSSPIFRLTPWDRPAEGPALFTEDFESGTLNDKIWTTPRHGQRHDCRVSRTWPRMANTPSKLLTRPAPTRSFAFVSMAIPDALKRAFLWPRLCLHQRRARPAQRPDVCRLDRFPARPTGWKSAPTKANFNPRCKSTRPTADIPKGEVPAAPGHAAHWAAGSASNGNSSTSPTASSPGWTANCR